MDCWLFNFEEIQNSPEFFRLRHDFVFKLRSFQGLGLFFLCFIFYVLYFVFCILYFVFCLLIEIIFPFFSFFSISFSFLFLFFFFSFSFLFLFFFFSFSFLMS